MSTDGNLDNAPILATQNLGPTTNQDTLTELLTADVADSLDVLSLLSTLLPRKDSVARDLIVQMGERSSPKEVIMAVQEELEKIAQNSEDVGVDENENSWVERLIELLRLCCAAIPRLKLRKRTASETLQPVLASLGRAMDAVSSSTRSDEGKTLMNAAGNMARAVSTWAQDQPDPTNEEIRSCQLLLKMVLDHALVLFKGGSGYDTAQRALEVCFPRLRMSGQTQSSDEEQHIIEAHLSTYKHLRFSLDELIDTPSIVSAILLAHTWLTGSLQPQVKIISPFVPSIFAMLQPASNLQSDALAFLLLNLHQNQTNLKSELSPDAINTFVPELIELSSTHPSPQTRHQAFRALSLLLASSPSQLRLQLLADLVAKCEYPQMRVAAVGLVKDAVLEALSPSESTSARNVFASPMFMRVFGPLLFRPSPPDLFDMGTQLNIEEFLESPEPKRIVEVLSLYYVILLRDKTSSTGIRDQDMLVTVEQNLLGPLRVFIEAVIGGEGLKGDHGDAVMPLVSLQLGLSRIDEAKATLRQQHT